MPQDVLSMSYITPTRPERLLCSYPWMQRRRLTESIGLTSSRFWRVLAFRDEYSLPYSNPSARVYSSNLLSKPFHITNGTRQGCPLSPLVFNLMMEPLAEHIRSNPAITGITIGSQTHKISLFADNVILMLTNPSHSLPEIQKVLSWFGEVSFYKANASKSQILDLRVDPITSNLLQHQFTPGQLQAYHIWVLTLQKITQDLFAHNYIPMRTKIQQDLHKLGNIEFSWWGRLAAFKMIHLPQLLYLFCNLMIPVPTSYFRSLQVMLAKYVWKGKKSRCSHAKLIKHRLFGGVGYVDFRDYFSASVLTQMREWFQPEPIDRLGRNRIHLLPPRSTQSVAFCRSSWPTNPDPPCALHDGYHPNVAPISSTHTSLGPKVTMDIPIVTLSQMINPLSIRLWQAHGIKHVKDLYSADYFKPFEQLQKEFGLPQTSYYQYMQVKHCLRTISAHPHFIHPSAWLFLSTSTPQKKRHNLLL